MKALYRKYRPVKLADVVGQDQVTNTLQNALKSHKISHAYLFTGPRGCGKTSVARIFAHEINGFEYKLEDSYVDIIEIDAASNTGVDNIRELRERVGTAPTLGKFKVYIIDEVHMLTKQAFNALLKTIEEPPAHAVFIMATTDAYKVPVTITSRAQNFTFNLATPDIMQKHLKSIAKQEKIEIEDAALDLIIERGGGSFRDSISLLDQISTISSGKIDQQTVINLLGLPENTLIDTILSAYESGDITIISDSVTKALSGGTKPEIFAESIIKQIISQPKPALLPLLKRLPEVSAPFPEAKLLYALLGDFAMSPAAVTTTVAPPKTPLKAIDNSTSPNTKVQPEMAPESPKTPINANFDWETYISDVSTSNRVVGNYLKKAKYLVTPTTVTIVPERAVHKSIFEKSANREILVKHLGGRNLELLDHDAKLPAKDTSPISQISDIMGNIQEVTDGNPFE